MNIKGLLALASSGVAALGAVMTFKPEVVFAESYSFFEYASSILAVPLLVLGIGTMALCGLLFLPGATDAGKEVLKWREAQLVDVARQLLRSGKVTLAVFAACLCVAAYEAYLLGRNGYSFARDQLFAQYRLESLARHKIDLSLGNLYVAKQGLQDYADRFKGAQSASNATSTAAEIDRILALKAVLVKRARERDKIFGPNRTSLHMKGDALALHPWDSGLADEIKQELSTIYKEYLPQMVADASFCETGGVIAADKARLGRHLVLLGFERAAEIGVHGSKAEEWKERFCALVKGVPPERLTSIVDEVWQREAIKSLLARSEHAGQQRLRSRLFGELRRVESKWAVRFNPNLREEQVPEHAEQGESGPELDLPTAPPRMLKKSPATPSKPTGSADKTASRASSEGFDSKADAALAKEFEAVAEKVDAPLDRKISPASRR